MDEYNEKYWVQKAMKERGGVFVKGIGEALTHATQQNADKIKKTWPAFWNEYLKLARNLYKDEMVSLGDMAPVDDGIKFPDYCPTCSVPLNHKICTGCCLLS